ncbi:MAG: alanine--tRNA ligase [Planctomycetota bacterium]
MAGLQSSDEIRRAFIDFFVEKHGHRFVPSSPVVPLSDPTLLFTNAGMNQFKPCFLEQVEPGSYLEGVRRAVNSQKCIRAGGKHNDLEDVGKDTYHHTFFEMLGNWSIGDYFKAEAIDWAWEFLTGVCGLGGDRLYATYFEGNPDQGLAPDHEARDFWLKHLPKSHVLPGNMKDNFWEMGETGPCGPCSELHYDRIGGRDAAALVNRDDPDVLEVWNLVFIQFNREGPTELKPLPNRHVDTGMGLERLVSVLADARSNYDTDLFAPLFERISAITGARAYAGELGDDDTDRVDMAYRVIADHARTLCVSIADGAVPSNEGRGYVLRRVLRRAVRFGRQMLGAETGLLSGLAPTVCDILGSAFPELVAKRDLIVGVLKEEEDSFGRTLDKGIKHFGEFAKRARYQVLGFERFGFMGEDPECSDMQANRRAIVSSSGHFAASPAPQTGIAAEEDWVDEQIARLSLQPRVSGSDAFQLYDTYGFPLDLTQLMAGERGMSVDVEGYERAMAEQKERSRAGSKFGSGDGELTLKPDDLARLAHLGVTATDDAPKHDTMPARATLKAVFDGDDFDEVVSTAKGLRTIGLVFDRTNFYAEAGGQTADHGEIEGSHGTFRVTGVKSFGGYIVHTGVPARGEMTVGETVTLKVDAQRRLGNARHHTATHLVNLGLRATLGDGVDQKGSLVEPDRLRFDFSHGKPLTTDQLASVEAAVLDAITEDLAVDARPASLREAQKIKTLRAVFGETYPDPVRVVGIGASVDELLATPEDPAFDAVSVEFCGGTHVDGAGAIGEFAIVGETGIAKGVRRVEAIAGVPARAARLAADELAARIDQAASLDNDKLEPEAKAISQQIDTMTLPIVRRAGLQKSLAGLQERLKAAAKARAAEAKKLAVEAAKELAARAKEARDAFVVATIDVGEDRQALQAAAAAIGDTTRTPVLVISASEEKVAMLATSPESTRAALKAGDWIREVAPVVGGKGGGKPDQAQGGGTEPASVGKAVETARAFAEAKLNAAGEQAG